MHANVKDSEEVEWSKYVSNSISDISLSEGISLISAAIICYILILNTVIRILVYWHLCGLLYIKFTMYRLSMEGFSGTCRESEMVCTTYQASCCRCKMRAD